MRCWDVRLSSCRMFGLWVGCTGRENKRPTWRDVTWVLVATFFIPCIVCVVCSIYRMKCMLSIYQSIILAHTAMSSVSAVGCYVRCDARCLWWGSRSRANWLVAWRCCLPSITYVWAVSEMKYKSDCDRGWDHWFTGTTSTSWKVFANHPLMVSSLCPKGRPWKTAV